MKDRRPRKLKKELKKRFAKATAGRIAQTTMVTAMSAVQMAMVAAQQAAPIHNTIASFKEFISLKALKTAEIVMECAAQISQIMNSGPKNWREAKP